MTLPLRQTRTPIPAALVVHTEAVHIAGLCQPGCPWCSLRPAPDDLVVIVDDPNQPKEDTP